MRENKADEAKRTGTKRRRAEKTENEKTKKYFLFRLGRSSRVLFSQKLKYKK